MTATIPCFQQLRPRAAVAADITELDQQPLEKLAVLVAVVAGQTQAVAAGQEQLIKVMPVGLVILQLMVLAVAVAQEQLEIMRLAQPAVQVVRE